MCISEEQLWLILRQCPSIHLEPPALQDYTSEELLTALFAVHNFLRKCRILVNYHYRFLSEKKDDLSFKHDLPIPRLVAGKCILRTNSSKAVYQYISMRN